MLNINMLRVAIIGIMVLFGVLLQLDIRVDQVFAYLVIAPVLLLIVGLVFDSFRTLLRSSWQGPWYRQQGIVLVAALIFSALLYVYGPHVSRTVFAALLSLVVIAGIMIELSVSGREPKSWLWLAYVWVALLFTLAAQEMFTIDGSKLMALFFLWAFLIFCIKTASRGKHRGRRLFCLAHLLGIIMLVTPQVTQTPTPRYQHPLATPLTQTPRTYEAPDHERRWTFTPRKEVLYPSTWKRVETVDPQRLKPGQSLPQTVVNPMPSLSEPMFIPEYEPKTKSGDTLAFILGTEDDGSHYLYAEGPIESGAYEEFLRAVDTYKEAGASPSKLVINTPGGIVAEGLKIGTYLRHHGWATQVDTVVAAQSTGGFIFISGAKQIIKDDGAIGFHRPFIPSKPDTPAFIHQVYQEFMPYWKSMGATPELYDKMMSMDRDEMFYVTKENADQYLATFEVHWQMTKTSQPK